MDLAQSQESDSDDAGPAPSPVDGALRMFDAIRHCPKPVIARVQGPALGGGVGLVFCADIRIARRDVYFRLSEVERGLVPAVIARYIVPDVGPMRARQLMMTARPVTATEALHAWPGFLTEVVDGERALDAAVAAYCQTLRANAPQAMADAKRLVAVLGGGEAAAAAVEEEKAVGVVKQVFTRMMTSDEAAYGIGEFLAKRRPNWDDFIAKSKL
ncbi:ClpP/crotonase-like domain-containing protein [Syncephalis pseudoplumigaleata]|uniref:ClpP/crotonase-like domain-containing protein n=1 Tax=Syncephalis pseudoplumigaleata TaxID=1712513 RepID=A0A4P9YXT9_9FUNG|nr:ClpP/crotonase-like domain-containing protein [Syncephalis pseudoplumigaleata]|eukprot:RKP24844.1 ClpP/crotonase-like domain-containing protein [Syncephalis pseudoplumigaleata]